MAILRVSNQSQLDGAVRDVRSGDTILLSGGNYSLTMYESKWNSHLNFGQKVTIKSENANSPAVITDLRIQGVKNFELRDLKLDYTPGRSGSDKPFFVKGVEGATFTNLDMEGQIAGQYGAGIGLQVVDSRNVIISDSEISDFKNGIRIATSTNVKVLDNNFHGMSNDSLLVSGATTMLVEGNDFRGMKSNPNLKHKDAIQFATNPDAPSRDVVIRDNVIINPEQSHGIFFTNDSANAGNKGAYYRDILIEKNFLSTGQTHGISINHGDGVVIQNNEVVQNPGASGRSAITVPLINASYESKNIVIKNNVVASVPEAQNTWTVVGNSVGSKKYLHWSGDTRNTPDIYSATNQKAGGGGASSSASAQEPSPPVDAGDSWSESPVNNSSSGRSETFRINNNKLKDGQTVFVNDLDFSNDDALIFKNFGAGAFDDMRGGNPIDVWNGGRAVKIDSALDLQELDAASNHVSISVRGADVILDIDGPRDASIVLDGLSAEFRTADMPDLF